MTIYIYSIVTWYYIFFYRFLLTVRIVQDSHLPLKIAGPRRGAQTQGWHGAEAAGVAEDGHGRQRCLAESHKGRWEKNHSCRILWFNDVNIAHIYIHTHIYSHSCRGCIPPFEGYYHSYTHYYKCICTSQDQRWATCSKVKVHFIS